MSKPSKHPAPKSKQPAPKQEGATKERVVKDAAPAPTPAPTAPKPSTPKPRDPRLPAPGTTTTRQYKGRAIKVKYLADGVEVDGMTFDSLSAAARAVTHAVSINGFLFFGLTQPRPSGGAKATPSGVHQKDTKAKKPAEPKIGNGNDLATLAGQRAALAAAGIAKRGRPITKPRDAAAPTKSSAK